MGCDCTIAKMTVQCIKIHLYVVCACNTKTFVSWVEWTGSLRNACSAAIYVWISISSDACTIFIRHSISWLNCHTKFIILYIYMLCTAQFVGNNWNYEQLTRNLLTEITNWAAYYAKLYTICCDWLWSDKRKESTKALSDRCQLQLG